MTGRRRVAVGAALALLLVAGTACSGTKARTTGPLVAPRGLTATASSSGTAAVLTWKSVAAATLGYTVQAYDGDSLIGQVTCVLCTSMTVPGLSPGRTYHFIVAGVNGGGGGPPATSKSVTVSAGCANGGRYCLQVDATAPKGQLTHNAAGLLHSASGPPPGPLAGLSPKWWRVNAPISARGPDVTALGNAKRAGARTVLLMSDAWFGATSPCGAPSPSCGARPPWADLGAYSRWVTNYVRQIEAAGFHPDYWDVQNEPDIEFVPGDYFAAADAAKVTNDDLLAQFGAAYAAVKSVDPAARIVGPSFADFRPAPDGPRLDLSTFLDYSVAHRLRWAAIAWHENDGKELQDWPSSPMESEIIANHVATARALIAARPKLGAPAITITEYGAQATLVEAGEIAGEIAALEDANVDEANRTCFFNVADPLDTDGGCFSNPPTLDGLLLHTGQTTGPYWVYRAYAAMSGRIVSSASSDQTFSVLGALDGKSLRVLVGRHETCTSQVNPNCRQTPSATPAPAGVPLSVRLSWSGPARVTVDRIPNGVGAEQPVPVSATNEVVTHGRLLVQLPSVADGDALTVSVVPGA